MTTTLDATTIPAPARPAWVTDAKLASWTRWVSAPVTGGEGTLTATAPYDARPTAPVPSCSADDVAATVVRSRSAQAGWGRLSIAARAEVLLRFHDLLLERQDEVIDLVQWEMGKARYHAWMEILQVANLTRHYAKRAAAYLADRPVRGAMPLVTSVREVRVPRGVVGIVSPWNYPLYLGVGDAVPALLAGCSVVSKADPQTPLTMLWTRALLAEAGLPAHVWDVVAGPGAEVGTALVEAADYVCFTGSTATGRIVSEAAARRLVGASLELGGKNPLLVRADADLDKAAAGTVDAVFTNTGQMCIHIERVIVREDVYAAFRDKLVAATRALKVGQTFDFTCQVGSLASAAQLAKVTAHVEDAVAKGATVLCGGRARPDLGPYVFEPTVLEGVTDDMDLCLGETFGPVVALHRVSSDEEAVALANQGAYGLSASIFSRDTRTAQALARRVRAGSVNINDGAALAAGSVEAGMGGMGESGLGRRHGAQGIQRFTETQTIALSRIGPVGPPPGMALETFVKLGNAQLRLLRRIRSR
ncbi:aldehyde dehydrogenase family protein [Nocardioides sp. zg-579]|uniref:Aldehyde dehydrogenase family protein n=1 Tax=Nocardioides marmotae TaxID=2663857 RepID=A0A6I3JAU6_9ACTN|nr:succinic semialdehyde dehydrogenase [Nocardioides marmotae]MCR6031595.1 aldehyde dehydrogenase family protein [Gordonia jinghuaiqii]MTB95234.1 aldehyde dehydrogenase family protein [Nocardioides marmotae]QKE02291.1 succinate-semialdehyde dehydrogenase (NADP(+)) [Nocardioides marmotae]